MLGIRAELVFEEADSCPVAGASETTAEPVRSVSWTAGTDGTVTEQFTAAESVESETDVTPVFDYGPQQVYEFERDETAPCICEYIEDEMAPVTETYAVDGALHVTLHATDVEGFRDLLTDLADRFGDVRIEYLVQGRTGSDDADLVPVDLRQLTDRQREVLEMAHEMGYFEYPRDANAGEVADALDIESSTFREHLNAAQSKLLEALL